MGIFDRKKKITEKAQDIQPPMAGISPEIGDSGRAQLLRHQSAPRPTAQEEAARMMQERQMSRGAIDGSWATLRVVGREQVQAAYQTLMKYKEGKENLENRIVENEQWYKLRYAELQKNDGSEIEHKSAWLFNSIANKHADAMDNFPSPNILPREEGDRGEAEMLSSIIPIVLDQCDFEEVYDEVENDKLKSGTGIFGIFWDGTSLNGLGDISVRNIDIVNLFWEPGIVNIQRSRNIFHVELCDNDILIGQYPRLQGKLGNSPLNLKKYVYDDTVDTTNKSTNL